MPSNHLSNPLSSPSPPAFNLSYHWGLFQHHSSKASILWPSAFFIVQPSHPYMTTEKTIALTRCTFVSKVMSLFFIFLIFIFTLFYFTILIGFAIHWHESTTGVHAIPNMNPPPTSLPKHPSGSSPCTSPKHAVSCIGHRLVIRFLQDSIHVSMPFSQIIPPSPLPSESQSPLYTSVSFLLSCIQGHHCQLSKFHIYVLVYCIGVFLSGLLHSV